VANAFYAVFGTCRRRGFTKSYCYREAKDAVERGPRRQRKRGSVVKKPSGMARKGSHCRRKTRVWSAALGKKVLRCTGGYTRGSRR
jgi:hypothetical protein